MKITMKKLSASPAGALEAGRTYDLPTARARSLIEAGAAVPVDGPRPRPRPAAETGGKREDGGEDVPLEKRTVDQLKAYAAERDIDLGEASKKAEILEAIITAEREREENEDDE